MVNFDEVNKLFETPKNIEEMIEKHGEFTVHLFLNEELERINQAIIDKDRLSIAKSLLTTIQRTPGYKEDETYAKMERELISLIEKMENVKGGN